jgi:lipopolysaccharide/colanic/teichoic acid biosynthesis glycosyltransferase
MLLKRIFDIIFSVMAIIIFSPVMLIVCILVYVNLGRPIIFTQLRPGKNNKLFKMFKFRSMKDSYNKEGKILKDFERINAFGIFLRSTSLDELPELWNVIKGDMSLVGPRPLLSEYIPLYSKRQIRRHLVKPGITGWAQVNGRNSISWPKKFDYDLWYVDNQSLMLDIKILFLTLKNVIKQANISSRDSITTKKFDGK